MVESVAPNRIVARLADEAPQTTALNAGSPAPFPRLNGFVVVPHEAGALVGIVTWIGVEPSRYTPAQTRDGSGLIDLPYPSRKMAIVPVGTLERAAPTSDDVFRLRRGVTVFPSVGDAVTVPSRDQLTAVLRGEPADRRVHVGRAPLASDAEVRVDPDKVFGRHLAVLGNTGSGKSCSVAGLIRWSLEAAQAERDGTKHVGNSRFIVLDPNGEYSRSFSDLPGYRHYRVGATDGHDSEPLQVPGWLMSSHEWASVSYASARVQKPVLVQALRNLRAEGATGRELRGVLARFAHGHRLRLETDRSPLNNGDWKQKQDIGGRLEGLTEGLTELRPTGPGAAEVDATLQVLQEITNSCRGPQYWGVPSPLQFQSLVDALRSLVLAVADTLDGTRMDEDVPRVFPVADLADELDIVVSRGQFDDARRHIGGLKLRVQSLIDDERMSPVLATHDDVQPDLAEWLERFLGDGSGDSVAVIDLSLVPSDVVEIVVAVAARMTFEALQRHRRHTGDSLPTALVLEEAHTFVRSRPFGDEHTTPGELCTRAFERIAREGRKFGLGLVVSSQRPSELSPTVLAQCNTFLLHRIVNDADQQLVARLVPDNLAGLLDDLPSLPSRHALLVGWAAAFPTLVEMRELAEDRRPQSDDPAFWDTWTGTRSTGVDWRMVSDAWAGAAPEKPDAAPTSAPPPQPDPADDAIPF
jgi:DNA helicase HerA-like ATPase